MVLLRVWITEVWHASNLEITNLEIRHDDEESSGANSGQPARYSGVYSTALLGLTTAINRCHMKRSGNTVATNFSNTTIGIRWRDFITSVQNHNGDSNKLLITEIQISVVIYLITLLTNLRRNFVSPRLHFLREFSLKTDAWKGGSSDNAKWRRRYRRVKTQQQE